MAIGEKKLTEIVAELATRPGHEKVRVLVSTLLTDGLDAPSHLIDHEKRLLEAKGRADALLGRTVFEFKRTLREEMEDAKEELSRYLPERERKTGQSFIGVATDGAEFIAFEMRSTKLTQVGHYKPETAKPRDLLIWLDSVVAIGEALAPDPHSIRFELGKDSPAYRRASRVLAEIWTKIGTRPDVRLKRDLWSQLLALVHGRDVNQDYLFFQHTYLTLVAKSIALRALDLDLPGPTELLSGEPLRNAGILGAVESDFFDWLLDDPSGSDLVGKVARQVARFRLRDVKTDVLKTLYESLVDPEERHDLGEYYTPDWLAEMVCTRAIDDPLKQRVLDPACGSGSFVFHAIKRHLTAAEAAGIRSSTALESCTRLIAGMDVHPVAVILARVTYLLALGDVSKRKGQLSIPIYLGEAMQWSTRQMLSETEIVIEAPAVGRSQAIQLRFPGSVCEDPIQFDKVVEEMISLSLDRASPEAFSAALARNGWAKGQDATILVKTYRQLCDLQATGRNHIWGYVARNLTRPLWLSSKGQQADVVVGNPPWLSYRYMSEALQKHFKASCESVGIWVGGKHATHNDLSACFYAHASRLYAKPTGRVAFVLPYAVLTRGQFEIFRTGRIQGWNLAFDEIWTFDETVTPLFPVPCCVIFSRRAPLPRALPTTVTAFSGILPVRDASLDSARRALKKRSASLPTAADEVGVSPYRDAFRQGATLVPRMLCLVERVQTGRFGSSPQAPAVRSRRSAQEKKPWKGLDGLEGTVESRFVRTVVLGEDIAPFRVVKTTEGVVPFDQSVLTANDARSMGFRHLARWLTECEQLWRVHGVEKLTFKQQIDFFGKLSAQFPLNNPRIVYTKAGTNLACAVIDNPNAVIDHKLYWASVRSKTEGQYLCAILNSEALRLRVEKYQSKGQWGARDFDKYVFNAPIPKFDAKNKAHVGLAALGGQAEKVAAKVAIGATEHYSKARKHIREALEDSGVATSIEEAVKNLFEGH